LKISSTRKKTISVVIPVYENAETIPELFMQLTSLEQRLELLDINLELIFVDDGSSDESWDAILKVQEARNQTIVIKLSRNFGSIKCSRTGLGHVTGDAFVILAADLQDPPELIETMAKYWLTGNKFVICERDSRKDPFLSKLYSRVFYKLLRSIAVPNYPKGGFDLFLLDSSALQYVVESSKSAYTPVLIWWLGFKPTVIKYERQERVHGKSKWTFVKKFNAFMDIMLGFSVRPIRSITLMGLISAIFTSSFGFLILINSLLGNVQVPGYASIATLMSFLLSVIIIMLGVIGEYLWRIFEETNRRPDTVIDILIKENLNGGVQ
jgi:polyisoprenyl-phosphate glycosyltransferase